MAKPPLQAAANDRHRLRNLDETDDRVELVDMLDGASDAACLAVLHRLDALPVPIKSIIKLVAKKLARVRKHGGCVPDDSDDDDVVSTGARVAPSDVISSDDDMSDDDDAAVEE